MSKQRTGSPGEPQCHQNTNPDDHFAGAGRMIEAVAASICTFNPLGFKMIKKTMRKCARRQSKMSSEHDAENNPDYYFAGAGKMVEWFSGARGKLQLPLFPFACYLITQNGEGLRKVSIDYI